MALAESVLRVEGLTVAMGGVEVVEDVSFQLRRGETLALVGESGCGKSVTALAILGLLPKPPAETKAGSIRLREAELSGMDLESLRQLRGRKIAMIFQEPMTALNPVFTIGAQIAEAISIHRSLPPQELRQEVEALIGRVGLPEPAAMKDRYPHELSGGQRQRVMIAMALANKPEVLIADEPTTALDVTVQAQILDLIEELRRAYGLSVLLITHDLGVVAEYCDRIAVMYAGRVVEIAPSRLFFAKPRHRYSRALLETIPALNPPGTTLPAIAGRVPKPGARGAGCAFRPRCAAPLAKCESDLPPLVAEGEHAVACWNPAL